MQFNRKWFFQGSQRTNLMSDDLFLFYKKIGFNYLDGEELNETRGFQEVGWKYDVLKYFYFSFSQGNYGSNYWVSSFLCNWDDWELLDYHTYGNSHQGLFFIPLKNNGFLINGYYDGLFMSPTTPLYTPFTYPYRNDSAYFIKSFIGFFNNVDNVYTYIRSKRRGNYYAYSYDTNDNYSYIDFPYQRRSARTYLLSTYSDITGNKTDVKQNICTMIKYPYENGFLSNLFIVTTAPVQGQLAQGTTFIPCDSTGLENKFFSFNGRNFYGIFANLAVELPAN